MGPSDDDQATVPVGQSSKIQGTMKLMALDTYDRLQFDMSGKNSFCAKS